MRHVQTCASVSASASNWRPLQFDHIALWIVHIDRRTGALRAVSQPQLADAYAVRPEVRQDRCLVIILDAQAKVIQVMPAAAGRLTTTAPNSAPHCNQIDQRTARTQLHQANVVLPLFFMATQDLAVEALHGRNIDGTQHDVVDFADSNHCSSPNLSEMSSKHNA